MNILLTGAFGNIGAHTLEALLQRGHRVRCFDVHTPLNARTARRFEGRVEVRWGDLRDPQAVAEAVRGQETVLHLAFVIPKLSVTGVNSEEQPDLAREVNVGGTANLLQAMQAQPDPARLVFASSLHVYGRTQDQPPPRRVSDPVQPVEHYARHKVECEQRVRDSGLTWSILRLPATLPIRLILDRGMFDVPLNNRIEFGHGRDVATAFANAAASSEVWGKTLLIGGGQRCQLVYRDLVRAVMDGMGLDMLPEAAFSQTPFSTDWLDTQESQRLLQYQQRTLDDYVQDMQAVLGWRRPLVRALRGLIRGWLLRMSPYLKAA